MVSRRAKAALLIAGVCNGLQQKFRLEESSNSPCFPPPNDWISRQTLLEQFGIEQNVFDDMVEVGLLTHRNTAEMPQRTQYLVEDDKLQTPELRRLVEVFNESYSDNSMAGKRLVNRINPDCVDHTDYFTYGKTWIGEKQLRTKLDEAQIKRLSVGGTIESRQNPDAHTKTQYRIRQVKIDAAHGHHAPLDAAALKAERKAAVSAELALQRSKRFALLKKLNDDSDVSSKDEEEDKNEADALEQDATDDAQQAVSSESQEAEEDDPWANTETEEVRVSKRHAEKHRHHQKAIKGKNEKKTDSDANDVEDEKGADDDKKEARRKKVEADEAAAEEAYAEMVKNQKPQKPKGLLWTFLHFLGFA